MVKTLFKKVPFICWKESPGKSFEGIVGAFLAQLFPNIEFHHTDYSHDGGKDYYAVGSGIGANEIWVEAKNYNRHLELSKFSNTFIMADISHINQIILFSMSDLTDGARVNIARYGSYHQKSISVYAGSDIFELLRMYRSNLSLEKYIENVAEITAFLDAECNTVETAPVSVLCEYYRTNQFNFAYRRNKNLHVGEDQIFKLPLYSIVAQEIQITNRDLLSGKTIHITPGSYDSNVLERYIPRSFCEEIVLPAASITVLVIYYKIVSCVPTFEMPIPSFVESNIDVKNHKQPFECYWLGEIPYIGDGQRQLTQFLSLLNGLKKRTLVVSGKSGVGKSRFLIELTTELYRRGYKIIDLDLQSLESLSLKSVLQDILRNIFFLDATHPCELSLIPEFEQIEDRFYTLYKDFYHIIFDPQYSCEENFDRLCALFSTLLQSEKIALLLDNAQNLNQGVVSFFDHVIRQVNNCGQVPSIITLCFNKDFLPPQKSSTKLYNHLLTGDRCYSIVLGDFSREDARLYLEECLDPSRRRKDFSGYIQRIIEKFGCNPFVLKQIVLYLKQRNIINYEGTLIYISNLEEMRAVLDELPEGISKMLNCRYEFLLQSHPELSQDLEHMVWSTLFFGSLPRIMIKRLDLKVSCANVLAEYGFAAYNELDELVLSHQLIEANFCRRFVGVSEERVPHLVFPTDDNLFLQTILNVLSLHYPDRYCLQEMLLRCWLDCSQETQICKALVSLSSRSPRGIMLPMVINTFLEIIDSGIQIPPQIEVRAAYALCVICQDRFDVYRAAKMISPVVEYEKNTFQTKLDANNELVDLFKYYTFQLPVAEKFPFLEWLLKEIKNFALPSQASHRFTGWLHNRYSKNLCSAHRFLDAEAHIKKALLNALEREDYESAAEAEIEYGNIFAYTDREKTAQHWESCADYILKSGSKTPYFTVYRLGYSILTKLLRCDWSGAAVLLPKLQELRNETFLYQKLFIDDVCADCCLIQYMQDGMNSKILYNLIPQLTNMQDESHMHTPILTLMADYKLLTVYRLLDQADSKEQYLEKIISLFYEMADNNIFCEEKLHYSKIILQDLAGYCQQRNNLAIFIKRKLPNAAWDCFATLMDRVKNDGPFPAETVLSDRKKTLNLLTFNYEF